MRSTGSMDSRGLNHKGTKDTKRDVRDHIERGRLIAFGVLFVPLVPLWLTSRGAGNGQEAERWDRGVRVYGPGAFERVPAGEPVLRPRVRAGPEGGVRAERGEGAGV